MGINNPGQFPPLSETGIYHAIRTYSKIVQLLAPLALMKVIWRIAIGNDGLHPVITYHYSPTRAHTTTEELLIEF